MFLKSMWKIFIDNLPMFGAGVAKTIIISLIGTVIGLIIGLVVAIVRTSPRPIDKFKAALLKFFHGLTSIYITFFRGTPMIVQAMVMYYGFKKVTGIELDRMFAACLIVSINTGAYLTEVVRGGIEGVSIGQMEAAQTLGLSHFKTMRLIILPQAMRSALPAIGNEFIINVKDTSVLNVISVTELYFTTKSIASNNFMFFETYFVTCIIYLIMTLVITTILHLIENKLRGPSEYRVVTNQIQV
ncbi:MAG: amino acid ABC transporter permease [Tissierellia bacterium]|nr:amino acid ABC transporter permease [Tissierellia bacterium]